MADEELVERTVSGPRDDLWAFETLVARHQGHIQANCRHMTGAPQDAEDLAQEVFVKAFFGIEKFEHRATFKTWLQRIKINHCLNYVAKNRKRTHVDMVDPSIEARPEMQTPPVAEQMVGRTQEQARITYVLDSLGDTLRIPVVLRDLDGLSYEEISQKLGITLSATKMRIKRGREAFRRRYQELEPRAGANELT